ncbi:hypothetical protein G5I_00104 [Acromyrmex echinatior]|uniref:Uncharacterized protein n=1 Tax=Acromyrmex echinatior TaxID=103372 RepID=F4W400_ACREC|nr:hypothetical protein G5I_00104 [Acromyrmex echinatior]
MMSIRYDAMRRCGSDSEEPGDAGRAMSTLAFYIAVCLRDRLTRSARCSASSASPRVESQRGNYPPLILVESREYSAGNEPVAFLVPSLQSSRIYTCGENALPPQRGAGGAGKKGCKVFQRSDAARLRSKEGRAPLSRRKGEMRKAAERSRRRPAVSPAAKSELGRRQGRWSADYGSHLSKPGGNLPPRALCFLLWHTAKAASLAVELVPYLSRMFIAYLTKLDSD